MIWVSLKLNMQKKPIILNNRFSLEYLLPRRFTSVQQAAMLSSSFRYTMMEIIKGSSSKHVDWPSEFSFTECEMFITWKWTWTFNALLSRPIHKLNVDIWNQGKWRNTTIEVTHCICSRFAASMKTHEGVLRRWVFLLCLSPSWWVEARRGLKRSIWAHDQHVQIISIVNVEIGKVGWRAVRACACVRTNVEKK